MSSYHRSLHPILLDVTDQDAIKAAAEFAGSLSLPIVGLVNNAGLGYPFPIELANMDKVRQVMDVNIIGVISMVQVFAPLLRPHHGRIVNVGSATGTLAVPCDGIYAASKVRV